MQNKTEKKLIKEALNLIGYLNLETKQEKREEISEYLENVVNQLAAVIRGEEK